MTTRALSLWIGDIAQILLTGPSPPDGHGVVVQTLCQRPQEAGIRSVENELRQRESFSLPAFAKSPLPGIGLKLTGFTGFRGGVNPHEKGGQMCTAAGGEPSRRGG